MSERGRTSVQQRTYRIRQLEKWAKAALKGMEDIGRGVNSTVYMVRPARGVCKEPGCGRPHFAKGYCQAHYRRLLRGGDVGGAIRDEGRALSREATESVITKVSPKVLRLIDQYAAMMKMSRYRFLNQLLGMYAQVWDAETPKKMSQPPKKKRGRRKT